MELPINKLVAILIVIIVIVAVLLFLDIIPTYGGPINTQTQMYMCCNKFLAQDCIESGSIWCDDETVMDSLRIELDMTWDNVKSFCNCPET